MVTRNTYYLTTVVNQSINNPTVDINFTTSPVEFTGVSVVQNTVRVYAPVSSDCAGNNTYHEQSIRGFFIPVTTPFKYSATANVFTAVGARVDAQVKSDNNDIGCKSVLFKVSLAKNGSCSGLGCCQSDIAPVLNDTSGIWFTFQRDEQYNNTYPCSYGMIVERSWYNFSVPDMYGYGDMANTYSRGVPVQFDFAIRSGSCLGAGKPLPPACRAGEDSMCADASIGPGYVCKCKEGFEGNPYIPNGRQDIDECALRRSNTSFQDKYPCHGTCKNKPGGFDCTCPPGSRGNATAGPCTENFPLPAKVAVGAISGILGMALLVFVFLLRREKRMMKELFEKNGGPILEKVNNIKIFKKDDLKPILQSSNIIGKGGFGEVFKGQLGKDSEPVAVKKPNHVSAAQKEQFANEVIIQSRVIHKNIVRLIGCCLEVDVPILVYEFVPRGSLDDILHSKSIALLTLDERLNIAAESAEGLAYMHSKTTNTILHGDVKPANILLDNDLVPKISDFGISRLLAVNKTQHTNFIIGDQSYMDPVYLQTGLLTKKSDVYSFGVVLLELISRKRATYSDNNSLVRNFLESHKKDMGANEMFDTEIIAETSDMELLGSIAAIAFECLNLDVDQRPEMTDVSDQLHMLKRSRKN